MIIPKDVMRYVDSLSHVFVKSLRRRLNARFDESKKAAGLPDGEVNIIPSEMTQELSRALEKVKSEAEKAGRNAAAALKPETEEPAACVTTRLQRGMLSILMAFWELHHLLCSDGVSFLRLVFREVSVERVFCISGMLRHPPLSLIASDRLLNCHPWRDSVSTLRVKCFPLFANLSSTLWRMNLIHLHEEGKVIKSSVFVLTLSSGQFVPASDKLLIMVKNQMVTPPPDEILTCLKRAKSELLANNLTPETASASKFSRLRSWDDCFNHFCDSISKQDPEPDRYEQATLNLAWYLASFGMYRGSSILLQSSRHILSSTVELILDSGIKPCMPGDPLPEPTAILELKENIQNNLGASIPNIKFTVSDTLVSKILMGTVGCCPAYDSNFIAGIDYINTTLTKGEFQ